MQDTEHKAAQSAGAICQGLILGLFLFLAICGLIQASGGAQVFRYQGF